MGFTKVIQEAFWSEVDVCHHGRWCKDCCFVWSGVRNPVWTGVTFFVEEHNKNYGVHRLAWMFTYHIVLPQQFTLTRLCSQPHCCNPTHYTLFRGNISRKKLYEIATYFVEALQRKNLRVQRVHNTEPR